MATAPAPCAPEAPRRTAPRVTISPSMLASDLGRLSDEVARLDAAGADRVHWDVMDGRFVPNLTYGPDVIAAARAASGLPFEAHLMVEEPDRLAHRYVEAGCGLITVHAEACTHLHRTLGLLRELGVRAGVALNPATPVVAVEHVLDIVDLVLVMTVNPGFGGQRYLSSTEPKVRALATMTAHADHVVEIEVDGGITRDTAVAAVAAGARVLVAGTAVFGHRAGPTRGITEIRDAVRPVITGEADVRRIAARTA